MLTAELIRTCSNPMVAGAALASSGCALRVRAGLIARAFGLGEGEYIASLVREFAFAASDEDWQALEQAMRGQDMPLIEGLRFIVENALDDTAFPGFSEQSGERGRLAVLLGPHGAELARAARAA